ncbi:MAG: plasmid pRiA4b ORF-3 family protein [Chloroflexota bacterium]|nr:plasmid pRiA4b ORF-3 family protein [Chloroflexota bacterium]
MGWHGDHLHAFDIDGRQYGERGTVDDVADEDRLILMGLVKSRITRFIYRYDFGDDWEHAVIIEKIQSPIEGKSYPACVGGKRNCPPEDCGGIWGYENLLKIIADPTHPEHAEQIEWLGREFDPKEFSAEFADTMLAAQFTRK